MAGFVIKPFTILVKGLQRIVDKISPTAAVGCEGAQCAGVELQGLSILPADQSVDHRPADHLEMDHRSGPTAAGQLIVTQVGRVRAARPRWHIRRRRHPGWASGPSPAGCRLGTVG